MLSLYSLRWQCSIMVAMLAYDAVSSRSFRLRPRSRTSFAHAPFMAAGHPLQLMMFLFRTVWHLLLSRAPFMSFCSSPRCESPCSLSFALRHELKLLSSVADAYPSLARPFRHTV